MGDQAARFLLDFLLILVGARACGELAERLRQPPVLGEVLAGVILGWGLFGFRAESPALSALSDLGMILLMFEAGLGSSLPQLLGRGLTCCAVALVGIALPFALVYGAMTAVHVSTISSLFVGAALTATSVGITARVLEDLGALGAPESQIVLGAAVVDDVLALVLLAAFVGFARTGAFSWQQAAATAGLAGGFLAACVLAGPDAARFALRVAERLRVKGGLVVASLGLALVMALLGHAFKAGAAVGAFAAGLMLAQTPRRAEIEQSLSPFSAVLIPVFFVLVGARVRLGLMNPFTVEGAGLVWLTAGLSVLAVAGKILSGWAAWGSGLRRWAIGVGMVPRGEVGLLFAQLGLSAGLIPNALYAAVVGVVLVTTLAAPPLLKSAFSRPS